MKLVLVRHATGEDREAFAQTGEPDDARPLTKDGRRRMKRAARGLHEIVDDTDMIVTSPLIRAVQTARILAAEFDAIEPLTLPSMSPDANCESFLEWLKRLDDVQTLIAVGHEPHISRLASWLITGHHSPLFEMKRAVQRSSSSIRMCVRRARRCAGS